MLIISHTIAPYLAYRYNSSFRDYTTKVGARYRDEMCNGYWMFAAKQPLAHSAATLPNGTIAMRLRHTNRHNISPHICMDDSLV